MASLPYAEIEHTADLCLHVTGADLPELFVHAAEGLFALLRCRSGESPLPTARTIVLESEDLESLLVDWLNELLYLSERYSECYHTFAVNLPDEQHLEAMAKGLSDQRAGRCIKAATFCDLHIERTTAGYEASITFDV